MDSQPSPVTRAAVRPGVLLWSLAATQLIGWATLYFSFPVFARPIEQEFGWSSAQVDGALTAGLFVADLAAIPVGRYVDRHGGRLVMTVGALIGALLLAVMSRVNTLLGFYLVWIGIGLAQTSALNAPPYAVLTANIPNYRRALTHISFVTGLASTVAIPVASVLVSAFGWRTGLLGLAAIQFLGPTCIHFVVLRDTHGERARLPVPRAGEPSRVSRVMRTRAFWLFAVAFSVHWFVSAGLSIHLLPLLRERGVSEGLAVTLVAAQGPVSVATRMAVFLIGPNATARRVGCFMFPLFTAATALLLVGTSLGTAGLATYVLAMGMSSGSLFVVRQVGLAELFGTVGYGAVTGALNTVSILPRTTAPLAFALLHDGLGGYPPVIGIMIGLGFVGTAAFWAAMAAKPRL